MHCVIAFPLIPRYTCFSLDDGLVRNTSSYFRQLRITPLLSCDLTTHAYVTVFYICIL